MMEIVGVAGRSDPASAGAWTDTAIAYFRIQEEGAPCGGHARKIRVTFRARHAVGRTSSHPQTEHVVTSVTLVRMPSREEDRDQLSAQTGRNLDH